MITRHRGRRGPCKIIMQYASEPFVVRKTDVFNRPIETSYRPLIHFLMQPIAAVSTNDRSLITILVRVFRWSAECLRPIRGKALSMLRVITVAESVTDDLVFQYASMPRAG